MNRSRPQRPAGLRRFALAAAVFALAPVLGLTATAPAQAASSDACTDGGYSLVNASGAVVASSGPDGFRGTVSAAALGAEFLVRGTYNQFFVRSSDFAISDYAFTGAANAADMTGGTFTPVWANKVPDHRGLSLAGDVTARLDAEGLRLERSGTGLAMKIQSKDCAQGGIFQMEPERADGTATRITHTLAQASIPFRGAGTTSPYPFYFDNPNFRARIGQLLGSGCAAVNPAPGPFCVRVTARVNLANDASPDFVARDSAQVATRVKQPGCNTATPLSPSLEHCGAVTLWDVASGGRMGFVTGEDAVEVANPPTVCVADCQALNQVQGRLAVLGHPFPVPAGSRLVPAF